MNICVCVQIHWYVQLKMCISRSSPVNVVCVALARLCELLGCCQQLLGVRVGVLEKKVESEEVLVLNVLDLLIDRKIPVF